LPKIGKTVITPKGKGKVIRHNVIGGRLTAKLEDDSEIDFLIKDIEFHQEDHSRSKRSAHSSHENDAETTLDDSNEMFDGPDSPENDDFSDLPDESITP
jgi:hypothetical protein